MLFPYTFVPHQMDTMQDYVVFIFEQVWLKAQPGQNYDVEILFATKPELKAMITELHTQELQGADQFLTSLQALFELFQPLNQQDRDQLKTWFDLNNDIEKLCNSGEKYQPATYQVIEQRYPNLVPELKKFYKNLYSSGFLKLASVKSRVGDISDHNNQFTANNKKDVCPFCGLSGMLGQYNTKREAYDHYFPKDKYPFNSINFRNLVPACSHCNSSYKLAGDPHFDSKDPLQTPRKVFYPFANQPYQIDVTVQITNKNWELLTPNDLSIEYGPADISEEINTWRDVYDIDERYKAECCSEGAGKAWLTEVFDEWKELGGAPDEYMSRFDIHHKRDPYIEKRFLKKAFLDGCQQAGLFNEI